jgi:hypothetical protein
LGELVVPVLDVMSVVVKEDVRKTVHRPCVQCPEAKFHAAEHREELK